jgi:hypothetical protein
LPEVEKETNEQRKRGQGGKKAENTVLKYKVKRYSLKEGGKRRRKE